MPASRLVSRLLLLAASIACAASAALAVTPARSSAPKSARPARARYLDLIQQTDINDLRMKVTNGGWFAFDATVSAAGLEFPASSGKFACFAGGLWLGARVNGNTRVAVAEYTSEFAPGPIVAGVPSDPNDVTHVVYRLDRSNSNPAALAQYQAGAVPFGAPPVTVLPDNTLDIPGDQMFWAVYNDADPANHSSDPGSTLPLGVEVQQTTFAFDDPGPLGRTIYMTFRIINKSANTLDSLHVGLWADPDIGTANDDLVGSVVQDALGYAYNGTNADLVYGPQAPAVGLTFIEWGRPSTASFAVYSNGTDPQSSVETYNWLRGRLADGTPIVDPESGAPFMFAGDPVTGTGSIDVLPQDRRFLLSVGAVTLAPGDTVTSTWALVLGQENDRLGSVERLRCDASSIRSFWLNRHLNPPHPTRLECTQLVSCPRSSSFWADQCGPAHDFGPSDMATIAGRIDNRSLYFDWTANPFASFCQTFSETETPRQHAEREFASLLANLSTGTILPASGDPVVLRNVEVSCNGIDAGTILELAATAVTGLSADYLDLVPTHPVPIAGVDLGLHAPFGGGATTGDEFFGSRLHPADQPDSFPRVELRFGGSQLAHRYLRFENEFGAPPANYPNGRGYVYAGRHAVPFTVWDADHNVQLEVGYIERTVVDDDGTILPAAFQLATFDSTWSPDDSQFGGREYLFVFSYGLGGGASELAVDAAVIDGDVPTLYALWARRVSADAVFDSGDKFFFEWGTGGSSIDALMLHLADLPLEQANPAYQQIADCLGPINHGIGIGPVCDAPTAVLISVVSAEARPDGIALAWYASEAVSVTIERRIDNDAWLPIATRASDGSGRISFHDRDVATGHRYSYRLRYRDGADERVTGETSVDLATNARTDLVGFVPNPARGKPGVAFSLASDRPATLAIHDIAGRRVGSFEVGRLGRGAHVLQLDDVRLASGVYLLRLTQDGRTVTARSALVH